MPVPPRRRTTNPRQPNMRGTYRKPTKFPTTPRRPPIHRQAPNRRRAEPGPDLPASFAGATGPEETTPRGSDPPRKDPEQGPSQEVVSEPLTRIQGGSAGSTRHRSGVGSRRSRML